MSDQRNAVRVWLDRIQYIISAGSLLLITWLLVTVQAGDKNNAVFKEALINMNNSVNQLSTRVSILEEIRVEMARTHYTKPEVESLVDRSIRPLQKDVNRVEESTRRVESKVDKIYEMVKK